MYVCIVLYVQICLVLVVVVVMQAHARPGGSCCDDDCCDDSCCDNSYHNSCNGGNKSIKKGSNSCNKGVNIANGLGLLGSTE